MEREELERILVSPIDIPEGTSGKLSVEHKYVPEGETFSVVSMRTAIMTGQPPLSISFAHPVRIHYLKEQDVGVWMSDIPAELYQMHQAVEKIHGGDVLVAGLGLGVITKMLSMREDVKSLTVVEISKNVANLVWEHLDLGDEHTIIYGDINPVLDGMIEHGTKFDSIFLDTWQPDSETVFFKEVLPMREKAEQLVEKSTDVIAWQEDVMRGQLKFGLTNLALMPERLEQISLKDLQKFKGDPYLDWKVAFIKWIKDLSPSQDTIVRMAEQYVERYGSPQWKVAWSPYYESI